MHHESENSPHINSPHILTLPWAAYFNAYGIPPGAPPPYHAVGHLFFRTMAELESALQATAAEFVADERNYTNVPSVVQISEVVE